MIGKIVTEERCSQCKKPLRFDENRRGFFCSDGHHAAPRTMRVKFGRGPSKRFRSLPEAQRWLTGLRFKAAEGTLDKRDYQQGNPLGFAVQAEKWLAIKKTEVKHNSFRDLKLSMAKATTAWGNRNVKALTFGDIEDFLVGLQVSDKTRANVRSALHQFFHWLKRREGITPPEIPEVKFELGWRNIIDIETQAAIIEEVRRIAPHRCWLGIRWLATYVAIRPNEMRNLREMDIDVNGMIIIPSPKEKTPKLVPMLDEDRELFRAMPRGIPMLPFFRHEVASGYAKAGQQYSKDFFWRIWTRACQNLGIKGVCLYAGTRHSGVTALGAHFSPEEIQRSGTFHTSNKAFARYFQAKVKPSLRISETLAALAGRRPALKNSK